MTPETLTAEDEAIRAASPALWATLSPKGRQVQQPVHFLPLQTAQARGKTFNATIGQITDGRGKAVPLPTMAAALGGLDEAARSQAFLYSPVEGLADLRRAWRDRQGHRVPSSLPIVTVGAEQARALILDLFAWENRSVFMATPVSEGAVSYMMMRLNVDLLVNWKDRPEGEPVLVIADLAKGGREDLIRAADGGPVVAVVNHLFEDLVGVHENLVPIRVESVEALRLGFITFPFAAESAVAEALEKKVKMLLRAQVGSPPAAMQSVLLRYLSQSSS